MASKDHPYNGIVNIYKPAGFTSFDVVAKCRGIFGMRKIGHTGTLDPDAVGVLPICMGNATKVIDLLTDYDKEYIAELILGYATDTQDDSGQVMGFSQDNCERAGKLSAEEIERAIKSFVGDYMQVPPMFSALKVNGQKLYDLARKGIEVERKARPVVIHEIEILDFCKASRRTTDVYEAVTDENKAGELSFNSSVCYDGELPVVRMRVRCSKGTYIRTLCDDIGKKLSVDGTMLSLKRSKVGPFVLENSFSLDQLQNLKDSGELATCVASVDSLFDAYEKLTVTDEGLKALQNGNKLPLRMVNEHIKQAGHFRIYRPDGSFAAIYTLEDEGKVLSPVKMFL